MEFFLLFALDNKAMIFKRKPIPQESSILVMPSCFGGGKVKTITIPEQLKKHHIWSNHSKNDFIYCPGNVGRCHRIGASETF